MIQMVRFEIKKMLSKTGGKIALVMIFMIVVIVSVFAVRSVDFVKSDGSSITGIRAAKELRYMKSAWTGYLTEDVFAEVIRLNAEVEETPEAQSKDWHESNKAYAMKQGYLDIRDIINSALSPFREYNYYNIDGADPGLLQKYMKDGLLILKTGWPQMKQKTDTLRQKNNSLLINIVKLKPPCIMKTRMDGKPCWNTRRLLSC